MSSPWYLIYQCWNLSFKVPSACCPFFFLRQNKIPVPTNQRTNSWDFPFWSLSFIQDSVRSLLWILITSFKFPSLSKLLKSVLWFSECDHPTFHKPSAPVSRCSSVSWDTAEMCRTLLSAPLTAFYWVISFSLSSYFHHFSTWKVVWFFSLYHQNLSVTFVLSWSSLCPHDFSPFFIISGRPAFSHPLLLSPSELSFLPSSPASLGSPFLLFLQRLFALSSQNSVHTLCLPSINRALSLLASTHPLLCSF